MTKNKTTARNLSNIYLVGFWLKLFELDNMVNEVSLICYLKMVNFQYTGYIKKGYDGCVSLECFSKLSIDYRRIA